MPCPNYIWHIDSHHKMIRWRYVIHGGVDGFSRCIVFLKCSDNNRATTMLSLFTAGVSQFGLPDRVRSDHGGENIRVWQYMISAHHQDYTAVITGSSVHNERIERLWRDVHRCIASIFTTTFRSLESNEKLDALNEVDLYCLHYVFLPRINKSLLEFQESWNNHALSSEGNKSPLQLFVEGSINSLREGRRQTETADVDVSNLTNNHVMVPRISFLPCSSLQRAMNTINPLESVSDNGLSLYVRAIEMCGSHLSSGCTQCKNS